MEAINETQLKSDATDDATCCECLQPASNAVMDLSGATLCRECAEVHYTACAGCLGLIAQDEAMDRDGALYCAGCFQKAGAAQGIELPDEEETQALITEYVSLHSEHKKLGERLEEIKERLKAAASVRQRTGSAVTLRAGEAMVRCSYTQKYKCDSDKVASLEPVLGSERFASLFERKISFNAIKGNLEDFLAGNDEAVEAVRDAIEKTETVSLFVPPQKK